MPDGVAKIRCFECVAEIDPDSRFCDQCGAPVPEAAGGTERSREHRRRSWIRSAAIAGAVGGATGAIGVLTKSKDPPVPPSIAGATEVTGRLSQRLQLDEGLPAIDVPASYVAPRDAELDVMASVAPQWQQLQRVELRVSPAGWKTGMVAVAAGHGDDVPTDVSVAEIVEDVRQGSTQQLAEAPSTPVMTTTPDPNGHFIDLRVTISGRAVFGAVTRFWATKDGRAHEAGCLCVGGPCLEMIETCELPPVDADAAIAIQTPIGGAADTSVH